MSLLSSDRIDIVFGPQRVMLSRGNGLARPSGNCFRIDCANDDDSWTHALAALAKGLAQLGWRGAKAAITLSNQLARFALVPRANELIRADERIAAARHALRAVFGERADRWAVVLDNASSAGSAVASGIEPELVASLTAALRAAELEPISIEPLFAAAFNACRRSIGGGSTWVAIGEPDRVCIGHLEDKRWRSLRNERIRDAMELELPRLLDRARAADGDAPGAGRVLYVGPEAPRALGRDSRWTLEWVRFPHADAKTLTVKP